MEENRKNSRIQVHQPDRKAKMLSIDVLGEMRRWGLRSAQAVLLKKAAAPRRNSYYRTKRGSRGTFLLVMSQWEFPFDFLGLRLQRGFEDGKAQNQNMNSRGLRGR